MTRVIAVLETFEGRALTDEEVAQRMYASHATIGRWKTSTKPVGAIYLEYIAAKYAVHRHWLETGHGPQWKDRQRVADLPETLQAVVRIGVTLPPPLLTALQTYSRLLTVTGEDAEHLRDQTIRVIESYAPFVL